MKYLLLCSLLLSSLFGVTLKVGDTITPKNRVYTCENEILYKHTGQGISAMFNPKTDRPYHCVLIHVDEDSWNGNTYTCKITK